MPRTGIEPVTRGFSVLRSTNWAIWAYTLISASSGDRIWTYDLRVMSPTSFQTAPPRDIKLNGWRRIRTFEGGANRFTVCPLWPLGNPSIKPINRLEPITCWLQISCSANWATSARPDAYIKQSAQAIRLNGWRWIRTTEATCNRFTVCPLWPLGNPSIFLWVGPIGLEPMTLCL